MDFNAGFEALDAIPRNDSDDEHCANAALISPSIIAAAFDNFLAPRVQIVAKPKSMPSTSQPSALQVVAKFWEKTNVLNVGMQLQALIVFSGTNVVVLMFMIYFL